MKIRLFKPFETASFFSDGIAEASFLMPQQEAAGHHSRRLLDTTAGDCRTSQQEAAGHHSRRLLDITAGDCWTSQQETNNV
jgi:hypothetical protein